MSTNDLAGLRHNPDLDPIPGCRWVGYTLMTEEEIRAEGWRLVNGEWIPGPLSMLRDTARETARIRNERIARARGRRVDIDAEQAYVRELYPQLKALEES